MVAILTALITGVLGIVGTYIGWVLPEKRKRPGLIADFLDTMPKHLAEMATLFRNNQVLSSAGHALDSNIDFFDASVERKPQYEGGSPPRSPLPM